MECGEQSVTMAGMKEMQLLSVSSWDLDNQVSKHCSRENYLYIVLKKS